MDTIRGWTPTKFPAASTREGIECSTDTTARLKACLDAMQFLCSAPFSLTTMYSVIENGSKLPKTTEAHYWRHTFSSCRSKMGCSNSFSRYPLPANSTYVSRSTSDPPTRERSDTEETTTLKSCSRTAASRLDSPLYLLSTSTHTQRSVSSSHVRTKTRVASNRSSNSTLDWLLDLALLTTLIKIRGNIPFSNIDCKTEILNKNLEHIRNFPEPIRILYGTDTDTNQYFVPQSAHFNVYASAGQKLLCP